MALLVRELPQLTGRWGTGLRAIYLVLLAGTLLMMAVGGWLSARDFFVNAPNNLSFGFVTGTGSATARGARQVRVYAATSEHARRSGLRKDDIILSINGRPVAREASEHDIGRLTGAIRGDIATVVTRSTDGAVRTHRLPRQADAWAAQVAGTGLNGWQRSALLFGSDQLRLLVFAFAAVLLYRRRRSDPVALLFGTTFLMFCHMSGSAFWFWHVLHLDNVRAYASIILSMTLLVALNGFPDGRFPTRLSRIVVTLGTPALLILYVLGWKLRLVTQGQLGAFATLLLVSSILTLVLRYRRLPLGPERQQIKWAVFGFSAAILISAAVIAVRALGLYFLPNQGADSFVASIVVGTICWLLLPIGLLVSLLRYRLYDADAAISRSASYSFLTILLVGGFAAGKQALELFGQTYFDGSMSMASSGVAAGLAALLITPLHHRVVRWSEEKFQKPLIAMRRGLPELVGDLRETASLGTLGSIALERIESGVRASRAALVVEGEMIASRGDVRQEMPVRIELRHEDGAEFGALLLGPRPDGSLYGKDERQALAEVAGPISRALRIVRDREAAAEVQAAALRSLSSQLAELSGRLDRLECPPLAAE